MDGRGRTSWLARRWQASLKGVRGDTVRAVLSASTAEAVVRRPWWPRIGVVRGFVVSRQALGMPEPGQSRVRNEVTLEVTSALNLVSTTVSGYLKFAS